MFNQNIISVITYAFFQASRFFLALLGGQHRFNSIFHQVDEAAREIVLPRVLFLPGGEWRLENVEFAEENGSIFGFGVRGQHVGGQGVADCGGKFI